MIEGERSEDSGYSDIQENPTFTPASAQSVAPHIIATYLIGHYACNGALD
jgi:hypothetical protein